MSNEEKIFTDKYLFNSWKSNESKSGPGSTVKATENFIKGLREYIFIKNIKTIADVGCGDFNYMKELNLMDNCRYIGFDIVKKLIDNNNKLYQSDKVKFLHWDIINEHIGKYDLVICKDLLCHLSYDHAEKSIANMVLMKSKHYIFTTFNDVENTDIVSGNWRPYNMLKEPFFSMLKRNGEINYVVINNIEKRTDCYFNKSIIIFNYE